MRTLRPVPPWCLAAALLVGGLLPGAAHAQPTQFALPVTATDGVASKTLKAGAHADATDDYDPGIDLLAPPAPPPGAFDARLVGQDHGAPADYYTDVRAVVASGRHTFRLTYAPGSTGEPIVLSWSSSGFHPGWHYTLVDQQGVPDVEVDLRAASSLDTGAFDETDDPDCAAPPDGDPDACIRNGAYLLVDVPDGPVVPEIAPVGGPIVVPPGGGTFSYRVMVSNISGQSQPVTADVIAVLPSGQEYGPIRGPRALSVPAHGTRGPYTLSVRVPAGAPAGTYALEARLLDGSTVVASDRFTFRKAASAPSLLAATGGPAVQALSDDLFGEAAADAVAQAPAAVSVSPNPTAGPATVRYTLTEAADVRLAVYDALGREVALLADGPVEAGDHAVALDGDRLPSGVYVWRLAAGGHVQAGLLTVLD